MDLVQLVMKQLGIDETQAKGGLGLIFQLVKEKLAGQEFQQVSKLVPGIDDLIKSAPKEGDTGGGLMGMVGSLASKLTGGNLGALAGLVGGFSKLNLNPEMIGKFIPLVMKFIEEKGGTAVKDVLNKVLKG